MRSLRRVIVVSISSLVAAGLAACVGPGPARADTAPGPPIANLKCPAETFPHAGAPRSAAPTPYEIPFTATLGQYDPAHLHIGGYLQIANGTVTATLGGPVQTDATTGQTYGAIFASICGLVGLPGQAGVIAPTAPGPGADVNYNNNFVFSNPIAVSLGITGFSGLPALSAYGSAEGTLTAQILPRPASNGGLNVTFNGQAKSTSCFGPALTDILGLLGSPVTVPSSTATCGNSTGSSCTIAIGNLITEGVPAADVAAGRSGFTGANAHYNTDPVKFTTQTSGHLSGRPVVGPVTGANATLVSNDFAVAAIDPNTVPAPGFAGATCTQSNANTLNQLLNLPSIPDPAKGYYPNAFYAPSTFAVYVDPNQG